MSHPITPRSPLGRSSVLLFLVLVLAIGFAAPAAQVQAAPLMQEGGVKATVTGDLVNLRSGPGTAYGVVGRAKIGETVTAIGKNADGSWLQVTAGGKKGWVSSQLVNAAGSVACLPVVKVAAPPKAAAPKAAAAPRSTAATGFFGPRHPD